MDVHANSYSLCSYRIESNECFAKVKIDPDYKKILQYLKQVEGHIGSKCEFVCGYEAGCMGYKLYHELTAHGVNCVILAPTTMLTDRKRIKTDSRDAEIISKCLAYHTYSPVYIPSDQDNAVKEYIRMRDDEKAAHKKIKQQINAFCLRHGFRFPGKSRWTQAHLGWLKKLELGNAILQEILCEYLALYQQAADKLAIFDARIQEFASASEYNERVKQLSCFIGISTHTALALVVETSDFARFKTAAQYSAYLGLVPGEQSSGDTQKRTGITKAGNSHLRTLLIEAGHCYGRGRVGLKSKTLKDRQDGNDAKIIAYADRANDRLRRKFYKIAFRSKHNIAATAIARELSCFVWGMMTENIA
jgi:transposase